MTSRLLFSILLLATSQNISSGEGYNGQFDLFSGWRQDELKFTLREADSGSLNQVDWKNIEMCEIGAQGVIGGHDKVYIRGLLDGGWVIHSKMSETFQPLSSENELSSTTFSKGDGGTFFDTKGGIGFHLFSLNGPFDLAFVGGYAFQGQNLKFKQYLPESSSSQESLFQEGLTSRYSPRWRSGFLGIDSYWNIGSFLSLSLAGEFHWGAYQVKKEWYSQAADSIQLKKWDDSAPGSGQVLTASLTYKGSESWHFGLVGNIQTFSTKNKEAFVGETPANLLKSKGTSSLSLSGADTDLSEVRLNSFALLFTLQAIF